MVPVPDPVPDIIWSRSWSRSWSRTKADTGSLFQSGYRYIFGSGLGAGTGQICWSCHTVGGGGCGAGAGDSDGGGGDGDGVFDGYF